jgi:cleavage and polyadenylation specificity factor subunit 1
MQIWNLPKLTLVSSTPLLATLQNVLTDSHEPAALSVPQNPPRKPQELDIEHVLLAPVGESYPQPHLLVRINFFHFHDGMLVSHLYLRSGQLAIYEALGGGLPPDPPRPTRTASLDVKFVKIVSKAFELQPRPEDSGEKSIIAEQKRVLRMFIPFTTSSGHDVFRCLLHRRPAELDIGRGQEWGAGVSVWAQHRACVHGVLVVGFEGRFFAAL